MPTAGEIFLSGMNYQGSSEAGGFTYAPLNTKPLEDLGRYTMLYKKSLFDQRQKDADEKILELAKIADININLLRGKDKDEVLKGYNELITAGTDFARKQAKTPQEKVQQNLDWQLKFKGVNDKFVTGKARAIKYQAELDKINASTDDADTKAVKVKQLDKIFDGTPVTEQFSSLPQYATSTIDTPAPVETDLSTIDLGGDANVNVKGTVYLPSVNAKVGNMAELGLSKLYPKAGTPEFDKNKPQSEIQATIDSGAKAWADTAEVFNEALQTKNADGSLVYYKKDDNGNQIFDEVNFRKDFPLLVAPLKAMQDVTKYSLEKKTQLASGVFDDKGFKYKVPTNITAEDFDAGVIDLNRGQVKAGDLLQAASFAQYKGDKFTKTVQPVDNAIQWYNAKTARINANKPSGSDKNPTTTGITTPAILFGEHINRVKEYFSKNSGQDFKVEYKGIDEGTRKALGISEGERVLYKSDGNFVIQKNVKGTWGDIRVGTIEDLKQGFINTVKGGLGGDGTQTKEFQDESEKGFTSIFGTTSGSQIFSGWGKPINTQQPPKQDSKLTAEQKAFNLKYFGNENGKQ